MTHRIILTNQFGLSNGFHGLPSADSHKATSSLTGTSAFAILAFSTSVQFEKQGFFFPASTGKHTSGLLTLQNLTRLPPSLRSFVLPISDPIWYYSSRKAAQVLNYIDLYGDGMQHLHLQLYAPTKSLICTHGLDTHNEQIAGRWADTG